MADKKKRAGQYPVNNIKSSEFLPKVFNTDLNKVWLDGSLDQMISKGDLAPFEGYIGSHHGKVKNYKDTYISDNQFDLKPAIVTKSKDNKITNAISFDDVANGIASNFYRYNYNSAYSTQFFVYNPPINIDKLLNHVNYYWVQDMPVYISTNTGALDDILTNIQGYSNYSITDDNNTFELHNGMLIEFKGNWGNAENCTYMVSGVGTSIDLIKVRSSNGKLEFTNTFTNYSKDDGYWDSTQLTDVDKNPSSAYSNYNTIPQMLDAYNNDTSVNKPVFFDGFVLLNYETNTTKLTENLFVRLENTTDVYKLEVGSKYVSYSLVTDFSGMGLSFDKQNWDTTPIVKTEPDYFVIDISDKRKTAWSRINAWVHITCLESVAELIDGFKISNFANNDRRAKRPIVEFEPGLNMFEGADFANNNWHGIVDFILDEDDYTINQSGTTLTVTDTDNLVVGTIVTFSTTYTNLYIKTAPDTFVEYYNNVLTNDTAYIQNSTNDSLRAQYKDKDVYYDGTTWVVSQKKIKLNQAPLFKLYTENGEEIDSIDRSFFGNKIFGYKTGTGNKDKILGMPLSYKDSIKGAEYEFENYIITEKYDFAVSDSIDNKLSWQQDLIGYNYFKQNQYLKTCYSPSDVNSGAMSHKTYEVLDIREPFTIPFGSAIFTPQQEYFVHFDKNILNVTKSTNKGNTTTQSLISTDGGIVVSNNSDVKFHNLIANTNIKFYEDGIDIEHASYNGNITVTRSNYETTLNIPNLNLLGSKTIKAELDTGSESFKIYIVDNFISKYHNVSINGRVLNHNEYNLNANSIIIPQSILNINDIIDVEYYDVNTNNTKEVALPKLQFGNSTNEVLETFTLSDTTKHWQSIMNSMPGFEGLYYSKNNYDSIPKFTTSGGTIFLSKDNSILHDSQFMSNQLNMTGALIEQANEYDAFITRFRNQVRRLYSSKVYDTVTDITAEAINVLTKNRRDSEINKNSNMVFSNDVFEQRTQLLPSQTTFVMRDTAHGDEYIRDHVYVYLEDNMNSDDVTVRRILVKDKDYTVNGNTITLVNTPILTSDGKLPVLEVRFHKMDQASYVPASLVKLGLMFGTQPKVVNNILYTHDNREFEFTAGSSFYEINTQTTDIVNAAHYELECMIYAGLVLNDTLYTNENYASAADLLPSQHRQQWFEMSMINSYAERFYSMWASERNEQRILNESVYDPANPKTWNYKAMTSTILGSYVSHYANEDLPGHYKGIYRILFGTTAPHVNPWHMLGYSYKPTWWDNAYAFGDATRFANLKVALKNGITSDPTQTDTTHNPTYARYAWDWDNKCPFDVDGNEVSPEIVLDTPTATQAAVPFVFGDFGPTEQKFRNSNLGEAVLIDALIKVLPAKAYCKFFQPGLIVDAVDKNTKKHIKPSALKIPGVVYGKTLTDIKIVTPDTYTGNITAKVYGSENFETIDLTINNTTPMSISMNKRIDNVKDDVVLKSNLLGSNQDDVFDLEYKFDRVEYVANGLSQIQHNYNVRNGYNVDFDTHYKKLNTQLLQKAYSFTGKSNVSFIGESSNTGAFTIGSNDYDIVMYQGYPSTIVCASQIKIVRKTTGYQVNGLSSLEQNFKFHEPVLTGNNIYEDIEIKGSNIKKYKQFSKNISVCKFGTVFSKIQDVYTFIRGYFTYLENNGYVFSVNKNTQASLFANWAVTSEYNDTLTLDLGNKIKFKNNNGHVAEYNTIRYYDNNILNAKGNLVAKENLNVIRKTDYVEIESNVAIGSITTAVIDYQHAFVFNDKTTMNNVLIDKVINNKHDRLLARGFSTRDWNGTKKAPGYLVFDDHIVENFDSSVEGVNNQYRTDITHFNNAITKAQDITIGNTERPWAKDLMLDPNVITKFYQGAIKEAGTNVSVDRLARFIKGAEEINMSEEYMFNHSYMGDTTRKQSTEIFVKQSQLNNNPQIFEFANTNSVSSSIAIKNNDSSIVNDGIKTFETELFNDANTKLLTAGEALSTEAKYYANTTTEMSSIWDLNEDYAKYQAWETDKNYVNGDIVRHQGRLYQCNVDYTGLTTVNEGVTEIGSITNPVFPYNTTVELAGETIVLQTTTQQFTDIVATGTVQNPVVNNQDILEINNTNIIFSSTSETEQVTGPAEMIGGAFYVDFPNGGDGQAIVLNGVTVAFDNTPADTIVPLAFIAGQDSYTATELTDNTLTLETVTVGTVEQSGNYSIIGNTIVFNDITGPEFVNGAGITLVLSHASIPMNTLDIVNRINQTSVPGVTATVQNNKIKLSYTSNVIGDSLVLAPGNTNSILGFNANGQTAFIDSAEVPDPLTLAEVVTQINNSGLADIVASQSANQELVITKRDAFENLIFGTGASIFGYSTGANDYPYNTITVNAPTNLINAVNDINSHLLAQNINDVVLSVDNARIKVETTRQSLDFGNTDFNSISGLPSGVQANLASNIVNVFDITQWTELQDQNDPTLFNIWVVNDNDYEVNEIGITKSKFNDWNMFQVQNHGLFTEDPTDAEGCGICAGTATSDGNDAQITTRTAHNLQKGDYVLLTNTTTTPSIDGIHKVTQIHPDSDNIFYIDRFIEKCGNASAVYVLRNQRFETPGQMTLADTQNTSYNIPQGSLTYTKFIFDDFRSTYVYRKNTNDLELVRNREYRIKNTDIENIKIYDKFANKTVAQFELFDPLRGVIPGVANKELDFTSAVDIAAYSMTTDEAYDVVDSTAWANEQVGKRWWDTSTVRYYDYDQGDYAYQSSHWGKTFPGSSIDVYEWTKSTVTPDLYHKEVDKSSEMFGVVATGTAYSVYDSQLDEDLYYYTEATEWNNTTNTEQTVYYFWVKDKTVKSADRLVTSKEVADIIFDPTANGIAWFAAITPNDAVGNAFIISNASLYLNDESTVIQINMTPDGANHNSWLAIAKDVDLIPEYYYIGMKNTLSSTDEYDTPLPNYYAHIFNRFGDDRSIKQSWVQSLVGVRKNARSAINDLVKDINLYESYKKDWINEIDNKTWEWTNYVSKERNMFNNPTVEVKTTAQLDLLDTGLHNTALLKIVTDDLVDRSEIYEYKNDQWTMTEKRNSTISLLPIVERYRHGWDMAPWDTTVWDDTSSAEWWKAIITACREEWFVNTNINKFNKLFFAIIDYILSEQQQTNWVHKSTYVRLDITNDIETDQRKYTKDTIDNIIGYVNTVKPFHTKIRNFVDIQRYKEEAKISMSETISSNIVLDYGSMTSEFAGTTYDSSPDSNWGVSTETVDSGDSWFAFTDTQDSGDFFQPDRYRAVDSRSRYHIVNVGIEGVIKIAVQTNTSGSTVDADTRTFVYVVNDNTKQPTIIGLEQNKSTDTTAIVNFDGNQVTVTDATNFAPNGLAYINGEVVEFVKDNNTLQILKRGLHGTLSQTHASGTTIVDITDSVLTTSEHGTIMLNDIGTTILQSTDSTAATELQQLSRGIEL